MNILFQSRSNLTEKWGGDTTQIINTAEALRQLGVNVEIHHGLQSKYTKFDIVHIFNMQTVDSSYAQMAHARKGFAKIALSPIMWEKNHITTNRDTYLYHEKRSLRVVERLIPGLLGLYFSKLSLKRRYNHQRCYGMLENSDVVLPNSIAELEVISNMFSYPAVRGKSTIVYNASVKIKAKTEQPSIDIGSFPKGKYILQVARLEPIKGQMQTLKAIYNDREIPIVFVGGGQESYYARQVKRLANGRGNVFFYDNVSLESIGWFYQRAKVHVLPSLRESPGLATLEAMSQGIPCIVSHHAPINEYFGESTLVCDPYDLIGLRKKILLAWSGGFSPRTHLQTNPTWADAAKATLAGYQRI